MEFAQQGDPKRRLGSGFTLAVTVGGIVGLGILRTSGEVAAVVPDPLMFVSLWVLGGLFILLSTVVAAELAVAVQPRPTTPGAWLPPHNMSRYMAGEPTDFCPMLSPDGRYLFFSSNRFDPKLADRDQDYRTLRNMSRGPGGGFSDVYWVDASVIEKAREEFIQVSRASAGSARERP